MGRWGFLISFEGVEGSGKTTLAKGLYNRFLEEGFKTVFTREPGGTRVGERIRSILLERDFPLDPWAEALLLIAARRENVKEVIYPALADGHIVITDRFSDSTFAYQGYGRGLPLKPLSRVNKIGTNGLKPNLTFLVDLPVEVGLSRIEGRKLDTIEREELKFHQRVREGYLKLARRAKKRFYVLDGTRKREELIEEVYNVSIAHLEQKGGLNKYRKKR